MVPNRICYYKIVRQSFSRGKEDGLVNWISDICSIDCLGKIIT